jgi:hypothetical protein
MDEPMREMRSTADALRNVLEGTAEDAKAVVNEAAEATKLPTQPEASGE